ncbi:MAG TPA: SMC-Scp complex subunit ScpB [Bacillota bacterium]|nr:SMC-Scp complex subunit ScpB [Bacillota bacterium]
MNISKQPILEETASNLADKDIIEEKDNCDGQAPARPDNTELKRAIEAILFAAGHPVTYEKLAIALDTAEYHVRQLVGEMALEYNAPTSARGIMLLTFDDSCQLCTKERFAPMIREALGIRRGGNLSASSLEVLAVIAYNQPCTRSFVESVRGTDSAYTISSLCDKGLIEPRGRLDVPGRPILYGTTDTFLRVFGLSSLDELPSIDALQKNLSGESNTEVYDEGISEEQLL